MMEVYTLIFSYKLFYLSELLILMTMISHLGKREGIIVYKLDDPKM